MSLNDILHMFRRGEGHMVTPEQIDEAAPPEKTDTADERPTNDSGESLNKDGSVSKSQPEGGSANAQV